MIQRLIYRLLERRHFWRYATFSEVAELYASRLMRLLAINIAASFMSVFLYQHGYSVVFIIGLWTVYCLFKMLIAFPAAKYAALFGPKHGILLANLLYIPAMIIFPFVPEFGIMAMVTAMFFQGVSATLYDLCYMIDFSKVKSVEHAGKEMGYMNIIEKIAKGISPLIGGILAFMAGPQAIMWLAAALFALSSVPLFKTGEPVKTRQKLVFRGFPWRMAYRSLFSEGAVGFDDMASGTVWSLFVVVVILGVTGNDVYAKLGALLSVVLLTALISSYIFGRIIDRRRGGELLRASVVANSLVHAMRPFVAAPVVVAGVNAVNETSTTGYKMAYMRGLFDTADISGHRITYLASIEFMINLGAALAGAAAWLCIMMMGDVEGMRFFFFVAAIATLGILTSKFHLYQK
jgi:MFS family permease